MSNTTRTQENPNLQIPTPIAVISKSQYIPNPKTREEKIYDIRERVFSFAQRVLGIAEKLPQSRVCDVLRTQLVKSGTSIGANMEEADGAVKRSSGDY